MRNLKYALGLLVSLLLIGPLAFAALASLRPLSAEFGQPTGAMRLLQTFDNEFPQSIPMYSIDPYFLEKECGYDENKIFGKISSRELRNPLSPYRAYFELQRWIGDEFRQRIEEARARQLDQNMSNFELQFLRRCIVNSAFSMVCGYRVHKVLDAGDLYSQYSLPSSIAPPSQATRTKTLCRFLDGVAVRNGQELSYVPVRK